MLFPLPSPKSSTISVSSWLPGNLNHKHMHMCTHPCTQTPSFESKTKLSNNNKVLSGSDKSEFRSVYSPVIECGVPQMCSDISTAPHVVE